MYHVFWLLHLNPHGISHTLNAVLGPAIFSILKWHDHPVFNIIRRCTVICLSESL